MFARLAALRPLGLDRIVHHRSMHARFLLRTSSPLVDEPLGARIIGLDAAARVRVRAQALDVTGRSFTSWAEYRADGGGSVDPAAAPPLAGTYAGTDPFGLWWSMRAQPPWPFTSDIGALPTGLVAEADGIELATATLERRWRGSGVCTTTVTDEGLVAILFAPTAGPAPPVVVLGGSGGGHHWSLETAALLASHGFAALAVAYFGLDGLPATLARIPVECIGSASAWLLRHRAVRGGRVALVGASRGAELALLAAATLPRVEAVVAFAPSAVLWGGRDPATGEAIPSWTHAGQDLAHVAQDPARGRELIARGASMADLFLDALEHGPATSRGAIPVERIAGPVLLVSGGDDRVWPSGRFAEMVMGRLRGRGGHVHLHYPRAGHGAGRMPGLPASDGFAYHPLYGAVIATGGTMAANAASAADAWPRVLAFLAEHAG